MVNVDPVALAADVRARLTGPGGPFELTVEDVRGVRLPVWANRRDCLCTWLADSAAFGDRDYLVQGDRRLTYTEHAVAVRRLANVLATDYRVEHGDRVAILGANSIEWVVAMWATVSLGAIVVAGNAWWTAGEAEYSLGRAEPKVIIADAGRTKLLEAIDMPVLPTDGLLDLSAPDSTVRDAESYAPDDPAVIVYTSGTTGHPKGA